MTGRKFDNGKKAVQKVFQSPGGCIAGDMGGRETAKSAGEIVEGAHIREADRQTVLMGTKSTQVVR